MDPPWCIDVQDQAALTLIAVLSGSAWIEADGVATLLESGAVAVIRGPEPYLMSDRIGRAPSVLIDLEQRCTTVAGESVESTMSLGISTWGNNQDGETGMLVGSYNAEGALGSWVTSVLPRLSVLPAARTNQPLTHLISLLDGELSGQSQGKASALDRLLDLLLLHVVRWCAEHPQDETPNWSLAGRDPLVGRALELIHDEPARAWTVAELAQCCFVSRATLASRFRKAVGVPPMAYLSQWRLTLAGEKLITGDSTAASIAAELGFSSPFAFSAAFKRSFGMGPSAYRRNSIEAVSTS